MSVNFTDKYQNSISLMNVSYYDSEADYMKRFNPSFISYTDEEAAADFADHMARGFIQNITRGTYNGATDDFTPWELNDNNILDTIFNALHEDDFYNFVAAYHEDHPDELAELERWSNADWIREYTEVYEVFIIGSSVYVNQD